MSTTTTRRPRMSDEERRAYAAQQRAALTAAVDAACAVLHTDPVWGALLTVAAHLPDRGPVNVIAITAQMPTATDVRGKAAWRDAGRHPAKGSTSLRIFQPMKGGGSRAAADAQSGGATPDPTAADTATEQGATGGEPGRRKIRTYKAAPVYDVSQTAGAEYQAPPAPAVDPARAAARLRAAADALAAECPGPDPEAAPADQARALLDVLAAALLTGPDVVPGQHAAEAASAAHLAARMLGLDPGPAPAPQLGGITCGDERMTPAIKDAAERVILAGRRLAAQATGHTTT
ncbi:hypothetical protein ACFW6R_29710 [Streptomyces albidoflavus]